MAETAENTKQQTKKACCSWEIIDWWGEPVIIIGGIAAGVALVYAITMGLQVVPWVSGISLGGAAVAEWRVRGLAVAKKLMDSVRDLRGENEKLKETNEELEAEVNKFKGEVEKFEQMVGLLGDNVEDLEEAKNQLFKLYEQYRLENKRFESNNLLTLFGLVDKNEDSILDEEEIKRMEDYVRIVYGTEFDFNKLDRNGDGSVTLKEFFNKFRKHSDSPNNSLSGLETEKKSKIEDSDDGLNMV